MNKIYFLAPLIGLLIFGGFYWNFSRGFEARLEAKRVADAIVLRAKQDHENALREQAFKAAIDAAAKRKADREERDRIEEAKKKARADAEDHRLKVFDDRNRFRDQGKRLKEQLDTVKGEIAKLDEEKKNASAELVFIQGFVKKAEANQKYYYDLVDKIAAADAAAAKAAADAAAAAAAKAKG
jgi:chromosome segregation ATPase